MKKVFSNLIIMFVYGPHGQASDSEESVAESDLSPEELLLVNFYQIFAYFEQIKSSMERWINALKSHKAKHLDLCFQNFTLPSTLPKV